MATTGALPGLPTDGCSRSLRPRRAPADLALGRALPGKMRVLSPAPTRTFLGLTVPVWTPDSKRVVVRLHPEGMTDAELEDHRPRDVLRRGVGQGAGLDRRRLSIEARVGGKKRSVRAVRRAAPPARGSRHRGPRHGPHSANCAPRGHPRGVRVARRRLVGVSRLPGSAVPVLASPPTATSFSTISRRVLSKVLVTGVQQGFGNSRELVSGRQVARLLLRSRLRDGRLLCRLDRRRRSPEAARPRRSSSAPTFSRRSGTRRAARSTSSAKTVSIEPIRRRPVRAAHARSRQARLRGPPDHRRRSHLVARRGVSLRLPSRRRRRRKRLSRRWTSPRARRPRSSKRPDLSAASSTRRSSRRTAGASCTSTKSAGESAGPLGRRGVDFRRAAPPDAHQPAARSYAFGEEPADRLHATRTASRSTRRCSCPRTTRRASAIRRSSSSIRRTGARRRFTASGSAGFPPTTSRCSRRAATPSSSRTCRSARARSCADLLKSVMPAIDRAAELGIVDPDRLAVTGQSAGGYATLAILTQTTRLQGSDHERRLRGPDGLLRLDEPRDGRGVWIPWLETLTGGMGVGPVGRGRRRTSRTRPSTSSTASRRR